MHKTALFLLLLCLSACARQPNMVVITATFPPPGVTALPLPTDFPLPDTLIEPTANPTRAPVASPTSLDYEVVAGDTLFAIAEANGTSIETLLSLNDLPNPDNLIIGQTIKLPAPPTEEGSAFKIVPDSRLVRAPGSSSFNVEDFINRQPGYLREATDEVDDRIYTAAQIIQRVALEFSVDPRLLLALIEFRSRLLSDPNPTDARKDFALGGPPYANGVERKGLYLQTAWAADQLNYGYYRWHLNALVSIEFTDDERRLFARNLNAGTVGIQFLLSQNVDYPTWERSVAENGLYRTYVTLFGDPFAGAVEPLVPEDLRQPEMLLPFPAGQTWYHTGGPHGGYGSGSAWAAVDFAPPDDITTVDSACYRSQFFATAVADGVIARTAEGTVILDLDGDGDESTGWTIFYLHMAAFERVQAGATVKAGDRIGHPSCEGGFSNGTHMHIARRYNGEWIPVSCADCAAGYQRPPLVMDGWTFYGLPGQEYQGGMLRAGESRVAEQGRSTTENQISR